MSAIATIDQQNQKGLDEILVITDESDFYKNTAQIHNNLDVAIDIAKSLVYSLDEEGEKKAKADTAKIRKHVATVKKLASDEFKRETRPLSLLKDGIVDHVMVLDGCADNIMPMFDGMKKAKFAEIKQKIEEYFTVCIEQSGVREEFVSGDISSLVKLTAVTKTGALTGKTTDEVELMISRCLAMQNKIEKRELIVSQKSLMADINPPLSPEYLGPALYADDDVFESKLYDLVVIEIKRREETEARVIRDQEAKRQREEAIQTQLKAQLKEIEEGVEKELQARKEEQLKAKAIEPKEAPDKIDPPADGKVLIEIKAVFSAEYPARFSDGALADGGNRRLSGIFEKSLMGEPLDDADRRFISAFTRVEVYRVS